MKPSEELNCFALYVVSKLNLEIIWSKITNLLEDYKLPDRIIPVKEIPLTPNGKIDKYKLRELLLQTES